MKTKLVKEPEVISENIKEPEKEIPIQDLYLQEFIQLDELFYLYEDNWHVLQDEPLLFQLENDGRFNDKIKIKWLFKRYRETARNLNNV